MKKYKFIGTLKQSTDYGRPFPEIGEIYPGNHIFSERQVKYWACNIEETRKEWKEVIQEPTLESLTDQIYELAKKQGMRCDVVLEKKKEVEVDDFCAIHTNVTNSISISVIVRNDVLANVGSKESKIIEFLRTS